MAKLNSGTRIYGNLTVDTWANISGIYVGAGSASSGLFWSANSTAISLGGGGTTYTSTGAGNITVSGSTLALTATGPGAASVGGSTAIPVITTDAYGRISATSTAVVVAPAGTLSGATLNSGVTASSLTSVGVLTGLTTTGTIIASTLNAATIGNTSANVVGIGTYLTALNASSITGTLPTANVSVYEQVQNYTTNQTFYPTFSNTSTSSGNTTVGVNSSLTYNPSTGTLSATILSGTLTATNVSGTVTTANVSIYDQFTNTSTNQTFYPSFFDKLTGNGSQWTNSSLTYNPSTGALTATSFNGVGTFSTATTSGTLIASGNIVAASTTTSTSITTGSFIAAGGVGVAGNVWIGGITNHAGNVAFDGSQVTHYDSIIDLHTYGNLAAWSTDDGKDIGLRLHYYNGADSLAFLGLENTSRSLQFLINATETNSNVSGTFGNVQFGSLLLSNSTTSGGTTSGALVVTGGMGITGDAYHGGNVVHTNRSYAMFTPTGSVNWIGLRAPSSVTANVIFNLPSADGTAGQFLKTDGAGNFSFAAGGGASSGFAVSTITTHPAASANKSLGTGTDNVTEETPFASGGTDAFGVSLGIVYDQMEPTGSTVTVELGSAVSI